MPYKDNVAPAVGVSWLNRKALRNAVKNYGVSLTASLENPEIAVPGDAARHNTDRLYNCLFPAIAT
jgi:hypothetical protein